MSKLPTYIFDMIDFRGGYFTDVPSSQLGPTELLTAKNMEFDTGLKSRKGYTPIATLATASAVLGGIRAKIKDAFQFLLAVKTAASTTEFWLGTASGAFSTLSGVASVSCTTGDGVSTWQFTNLGQELIGTNGSDKPIVVYENLSGTVVIDTLEHNDARERDPDNWVAGQFSGSTAAYTDDTTDAQSTTSSSFDFVLASSTISSGFYIGCDFTFNRINFFGAEAQGTATMAYQYYGRATANGAIDWQAMTVEQRPTWSSAGDHALQWTFPIGSDGSPLMEKLATDNSTLDLKYVVRGYTSGTTTATFSCDYLSVVHNQYLSQLFMGSTPDTCVSHKNHVFLGAGNVARISPANSLKGWRSGDYQYFYEGGDIQRMVSQSDKLVVLLKGHIYGIAGNSWANWLLQDLSPHGTAGKFAACNHGNELFYLGKDGFLRKFDGNVSLPISKHIKTDVDTFTAANVAIIAFKDKVWIADSATSVILRFDPDTYRNDATGDGRVSFFKMTNYPAKFFLFAEEDGTLYFVNGSTIYQAEAQTSYDTTTSTATVPIDFEMQTAYNVNRQFREDCQIRRVKLMFDKVSSSSYGTTTFAAYKRNENGLSTYTVSLTLASGTGVEEEELTLPPTMDGKEQALYIRHNSSAVFRLIGYSAEVRRRGF